MGRNVTVMGQVKKDTKKELKKHAATIHCSNTLSLLQRKITNALLYHAYKELLLKEEHEITVKQLCRLIGYQGNNHAVIKEALRGLITTIIEWNVVNDETGNENWTASSIIASVSLEGPLCYYAYSPRMKQLLHSPSMFGKIDLVIQSKFRSSYGLALYENCIRYRGLPQTKWFEIDLFKKLMGVPQGKYDVFRDFKRRVLDKAVDEVNTYSDLILAAELLREGRKVVRIRFKLKERAKRTRLGLSKHAVTQLEDRDVLITQKLLHTYGFSAAEIQALLEGYPRDMIAHKMDLIESSKAYQDKKIKNLAGFLMSALRHDYQFPEVKSNQADLIDLQMVKAELALEKAQKVVEEIRQRYSAYREEIIHAAIEALPASEKKVFFEQFYDYARPTINMILQLQHQKYQRDNVLDSPQLKAFLRRYALRELDILTLPTPEEFVATLDESERSAWQQLKSFDPENALFIFGE